MFKNNTFKAIAAIVVVFIGMAIYAGVNGKLTTFPQEILGAAAVPFKQVTAGISQKFSVWQDRTLNIDKIIEENELLKQENQELKQKQIDYDKIKIENEQYKEFLN
ncbi:MAG: rod shape-determining protein MreC, partial [Oscillospiraceae bacterium]|nr:rod shape-determining protein MreC [Oscillospiraceae bacterium]